MTEGYEKSQPPKIGGSLPHDHYIKALHSMAISAKRIADVLTEPINIDGGTGGFAPNEAMRDFWLKAKAVPYSGGILISHPDEPLSFVWQSREQAQAIIARITAALNGDQT